MLSGGAAVAEARSQPSHAANHVHSSRPPNHNGHAARPEGPCLCAETSGTVVAMRQVPGFRVIENHYPAGLELPRHFHECAYLSYVLEGPYSESYGTSASVTCSPGVLRYLPPALPHANVFDAGSHCLLIEVDGEA